MNRRIAGIVAVAVSLGAAFVPSAQAECTRIQDAQVPVPDAVIVPDSHVRVILPTGYCDAGNAGEYPVLYLLHGAGDAWQTWTANTDVEEFSEAFDVIIVMPDGGRNNDAGWYSDWDDGSRDWETFHIDVLIDWIDANYRTLASRDHRAVAGLSMGGFGAMSYAGRHPDLFTAAASFSGAVDTMYGWPVNGFGYTAAHPFFGTPDERVWGNHITNADEWRAHNPTDLVPALKSSGTKLFLRWGDGLPQQPGQPDPVELFIDQLNDSFRAALDGAEVPHTDSFTPGGRHAWADWQAALHWALPEIMSVIRPV